LIYLRKKYAWFTSPTATSMVPSGEIVAWFIAKGKSSTHVSRRCGRLYTLTVLSLFVSTATISSKCASSSWIRWMEIEFTISSPILSTFTVAPRLAVLLPPRELPLAHAPPMSSRSSTSLLRGPPSSLIAAKWPSSSPPTHTQPYPEAVHRASKGRVAICRRFFVAVNRQ
jgi:hypothetical protein